MKAVIAALLAGSTAVTVAWSGSMSAMPGMDMPGGWTMSMAWMRMPGQSWPGAAAAFVGMWAVMMVAMMLPVVAPRLLGFRHTLSAARFGVAYFLVWTLFGAAVFPLGLAFAATTMRAPALAALIPLLKGLAIAGAGALQLTRWKQRRLAGCRGSVDAADAWREGLRLGLQCASCCLPATAVLLVLGVMDLRAMALVTGLIAVERLAPHGQRWARAIGAALVAAGAVVIVTAT